MLLIFLFTESLFPFIAFILFINTSLNLLLISSVLSFKTLEVITLIFVTTADIKKLEQVIIDSNNLKYNLKFAKEIPGADINAHAEVILRSGDPDYNYLFATQIPNSNIMEHRKVIVNSKNENILNNFEANIMLKDCIGSEKISKFKQKRLLKAKFKELDTLIKEEENKLVYKKHE